MADVPTSEPKPEIEPEPAPGADAPREMTEDDLEKISGGVTASDFSFTKKIDKSSPSL
jgi:bacteriocin-like protein